MSIYEFCIKVMAGTWAKQIKAVRKAANPEDRAKLKNALPAVTLSGNFTRRNVAGLIGHSGYVCIDIDDKHNPDITDWPALRDDLANIPEVYFSALSVSGRGVFLIIPISNPERHVDHFQALEIAFKKAYGITIDKSCKDVSRLRFVSSDGHATINENAIVYTQQYNPPPPPKTATRHGKIGGDVLDWAVYMTEQKGHRLIDGDKHFFFTHVSRFLKLKGYSYEQRKSMIDERYPGVVIKSNCISYAK